MITQIQKLADHESLSDQQVADALAELVSRDRATYGYNTLAVELGGVDAIEAMLTAMQAAGMSGARDSFVSAGIDFASPITIAQLTQLAAIKDDAFSPDIVERLSRLGKQTRYESLGGVGDLPTVEQIQSARNQESLQQQWQAKRAVVDEGVFDGSITTMDQISDLIGGA